MLRRQRANHDGSTSSVRLTTTTDRTMYPAGDDMDTDKITYHLTTLAKIMDAVNDEVVGILEGAIESEAERIVGIYGGNSAAGASLMKEKRKVIDSFMGILNTQTSVGAKEDKHSMDHAVSSLRDTRCTRYWTTAWGYNCPGGISITKLEIVANLWTDAVRIFRELSPSLVKICNNKDMFLDFPGDLYQCIRTKIQSLELAVGKLLELSPGLGVGLDIPQDEFVSRSLRLKAARAAEIHQVSVMGSPPNLAQLIRDQSILSAIVPIVVFASCAFSIVAWNFSTREMGRSNEADFWILLQSTIMGCLGSFTTLYPLWRLSWGAPLRLSVVLSSLALACNLLAILAYFVLPKIWSSVFGFFGSALQAFVTLQLSLLAMKPAAPVKQD